MEEVLACLGYSKKAVEMAGGKNLIVQLVGKFQLEMGLWNIEYELNWQEQIQCNEPYPLVRDNLQLPFLPDLVHHLCAIHLQFFQADFIRGSPSIVPEGMA